MTVGSTAPGTEAGLLLGTIGYMAPEQARGEIVTQEADVFALGVMLYELVTGRHPFMASSQIGTLHALMWESPEPPTFINPELPRAIDQLIVEMLQKDPRLRPGASEVMYRLNLAHDSTIAVALSAVTVTQRRAAIREIVGRDQELDALQHEFERAQRGKGRLVVISAEAGMGKTTLVDAFLKQLDEQQEPVRVGRGRCSERLAGTEAYLPVLEALDSLQRNEQLGSIARLIRALAPSWYAQIIPPSENDSSAERLAAETTDRIAGTPQARDRGAARGARSHAADRPVLRRRALGRSIDHRSARLSRPADRQHAAADDCHLPAVGPGAGTASVPAGEAGPARARHVPGDHAGLARPGRGREVHRPAVPGARLPADFARLVHERSEGNPLFMADLLRDLRRRQQVRQQDGRWMVAEDLMAVERELPASSAARCSASSSRWTTPTGGCSEQPACRGSTSIPA